MDTSYCNGRYYYVMNTGSPVIPARSDMLPYTMTGTVPIGNFVTSHPVEALAHNVSRPYGGALSVPEYEALTDYMNRLNMSSRGYLPHWVYDESGAISATLQDIVDQDLLFVCMRDKKGSQFVQDNFPTVEKNPTLRASIFDLIIASQSIHNIAKDMFGNFVLQKMIEQTGDDYGKVFLGILAKEAANLSFNRFSCRVVQKALEVFPAADLDPMMIAFHGYVKAMCTDQSGNHVVQKMIEVLPPESYSFVITEMCQGTNMPDIICNKFGCRVVQYCVEKLTGFIDKDVQRGGCVASALLRELLQNISKHALEYSKDEYANYIIQHIIKHKYLKHFANQIISCQLKGHLVSLSLDKFSSHVVEEVFEHISDKLFPFAIDEIFNGKVNPKNGRDSLEQMLFDQYGNYVIQRLLNIAVGIIHDKPDCQLPWFDYIVNKITKNAKQLRVFSSGKKIIDLLNRELSQPIAC